MSGVQKLRSQAGRMFGRLPLWLSPTLAVVVIALGGLLVWKTQETTRSRQELLWNGRRFTDSEMAAVLKAFSKAKLTDFKVVDQQIRVPQGSESKYLAALADGQALPRGFQAYTDAVLSTSNVFDTERERQRQLDHARAKDMGLAISAMDGIENAFVMYAETETRGLHAQRQVSASVAVEPAEGHLLDLAEVMTIRQLVAGANAEMKPDQVSVTDLRANRSWIGPLNDADATMRPEECLAVQQRVERHWQQKIDRVIASVPGARAVVTATLSDDVSLATAGAAKSLVSPSGLSVLVEVPRSYFRRRLQAMDEATPRPLTHDAREAELAQLEANFVRQLRESLRAVLPGQVNVESAITIATLDDEEPRVAAPSWADWRVYRARIQQHPWVFGAAVLCLGVGWVTSRVKQHRRRRRAARQVTTIPIQAYRDTTAHAEVDAADEPRWDETRLRSTLTDLVREDPDNAARILHRWMERAG